MRWLLAFLLLTGCGSVDASSQPDTGSQPDGSAPEATPEAGTDVPACNAPVASLSGVATLLASSVMAMDPAAPAADSGTTCAQWVAGQNWSDGRIPAEVTMVNGVLLGGTPFVFLGGQATPAGCLYLLQLAAPAYGPQRCAITRDYALTVP